MKLQIALDDVTLEQALALLEQVKGRRGHCGGGKRLL